MKTSLKAPSLKNDWISITCQSSYTYSSCKGIWFLCNYLDLRKTAPSIQIKSTWGKRFGFQTSFPTQETDDNTLILVLCLPIRIQGELNNSTCTFSACQSCFINKNHSSHTQLICLKWESVVKCMGTGVWQAWIPIPASSLTSGMNLDQKLNFSPVFLIGNRMLSRLHKAAIMRYCI